MARQKQAEFTRWMGPILDALRDLGDSGKPKEVTMKIARNLELPDDVLDATTKTGINKFYNQVAWARKYLVWEGYLDSSKYGTWKLTEKGREVQLTDEEAHRIFLKWVKILQDKRKKKNQAEQVESISSVETSNPPDDTTSEQIKLIEVLRSLSPEGFEKVIRELLRESGFENVEVTGGSADGGIDGSGVLEINPFVSFKVLFQCKRYKQGNTVSRAQVGDFRNAMMGRAEKGIIITTSTFSRSAIEEACRDGATPVELVDGLKLVEMFERVGLGLKERTVYDIDLSYFQSFK